MTDEARCVLLIDDDEALLESLAKRCRMRGFEVLTATTGQAGLDLARSATVDVAVVDLRLPDMDGLETITRLKEIRPSVGTILLTAFGDDRLREATEALNSAYFDKDDMGTFWEFLENVPVGAVNVLIVDDDEALLETLAKRIRLKGHEPYKATTGEQALQIARSVVLQVAVVDHRLPDTDGLIVITKLKELQPRIETVLLTGFGDDKLREATESLNSAYFDKASMGGFWGFIRRVLGRLETTMAAAGLASGGDLQDARELSAPSDSEEKGEDEENA